MRWIIWKGYLFRSYSRQEHLWEFNQLKPSEGDKKVKYMKETFAEVTIVSGVTIGEHDREYFYRDEKIDWENLK